MKQFLFCLVPVIILGVFVAGVAVEANLHSLGTFVTAGAIALLSASTATIFIIDKIRSME